LLTFETAPFICERIVQMLQLQLIRHFFYMKEITVTNIYPCCSKWFWYYNYYILMKFSVDIKQSAVVIYLSVVCRRNLVTNGCVSQAVDYGLHVQRPETNEHRILIWRKISAI